MDIATDFFCSISVYITIGIWRSHYINVLKNCLFFLLKNQMERKKSMRGKRRQIRGEKRRKAAGGEAGRLFLSYVKTLSERER